MDDSMTAADDATDPGQHDLATPAVWSDLSEVDLLMRLARRWRHLGLEAVAGAAKPELAPHQQRALLALARLSHRHPSQAGGVRVSELADHLGIAPRSATEVADVLEREGLALRSPDPSDRRAVLLRLTDSARSTVEQVRTRRREAAAAAVTGLSPTDQAELRRLLTLLLDSDSTPEKAPT